MKYNVVEIILVLHIVTLIPIFNWYTATHLEVLVLQTAAFY